MTAIPRKRSVLLGAATLACAALLMPLAAPAHAANDTPDEYSFGMSFGYAIWDDYDSNGNDVDDFIVEDRWGDGKSFQLKVYWKGKTYSAHAYNGEEIRIKIPNVPNNEKVYFEGCTWDDNVKEHCSGRWSYYFRE
ncbi:hypothetical protein ACXIZN_41040 [Amycolatopsis sp. TRM77291]